MLAHLERTWDHVRQAIDPLPRLVQIMIYILGCGAMVVATCIVLGLVYIAIAFLLAEAGVLLGFMVVLSIIVYPRYWLGVLRNVKHMVRRKAHEDRTNFFASCAIAIVVLAVVVWILSSAPLVPRH
jgi:hypothetical protein